MAVVARGKKQLWALIIAFGLIAGACSDGSDDAEDTTPSTDAADDVGDTSGEGATEDEPAQEIDCNPDPGDLPDFHAMAHSEGTEGEAASNVEPLIEDHLITLPPEQLAELRDLPRVNPLDWQLIVAEEEPRLGSADSSETVGISQLLENEYPTLAALAEPLTGEALDRWNAIEDNISTVYLPNRDAEVVLPELREAGVDANPVHIVFPSNHIGAYPGVGPAHCTWPEWEPSISDDSGTGPSIGVVDTGILPATGGQTYADNHPDEASFGCLASHGQFIESIIRQLRPNAEIISAMGFEFVSDGGWACWRSNEWLIRTATAGLPLDRLDSLNFSFGSELYVDPNDHHVAEPVTFLQILEMVRTTNPDITIYAAAGNMLSPNPVYPAALPDVIGVAAVSPNAEWILWDSETATASKVALDSESDKDDQVRDFDNDQIPYDWIDIYAPGCDLIGDGTGVVGEVVVWSGSSFATPIAAALATQIDADESKFARSADYSSLPESLYRSDLPINSQCG